MVSWYHSNGEEIILNLHVQPGAKRSELAGLHGEALKIRLAAPPVEGRANKVLLKFIAKLFDVPLRQVELKKGEKSRDKIILVRRSDVKPDSIVAA
jgi:uncharacterized protein (TIGR00251 family)